VVAERPSRVWGGILMPALARGSGLFEYICDRIVPGCKHTDKDESRDKLIERAAVHLREHQDLDHHDDPIAETLSTTGISFIRPV